MNAEDLIRFLRRSDLSKVTYSKIFSSIIKNGIQLPILTSLIRKGGIVQRGRLTEGGSPFNSESEISYRTDSENIAKYGRANRPFQSMFYGSVPTPDVKYPTKTLFSELLQRVELSIEEDIGKTMTVGRWRVIKEFEVADSCYSQNYVSVEDNKDRYEYWEEKLAGKEIGSEMNRSLLTFFSDMFSRTDIKSHHDYKVSSIYSDYAIRKGLKGVLYPSVKTDYHGKNIAITPQTVEEHLELIQVGVFKLILEKGVPVILQTHFSEKLGPFNSHFEWVEQEGEKYR